MSAVRDVDASGTDGPESIFAGAHGAKTVGLLILVTLIAFEATGTAAALPTAARALHGLGSFGWAFTAFLVANVVGMVVAGQLNDRGGARLPLLAGLCGFAFGLVVAGTAGSMTQLIAGRFAQGLGGGLIITSIYVVLGATYSEQLRPKIFAAISGAWIVPSLVGPLASGALAENASWRWVFLGLVPFVALGAALFMPALRSLPAGRGGPLADPWRVVRAFAVGLGVAALAAAGQHPSPLTLTLAGAGVVALVWGLRRLLPDGTVRVRRGVAAPVALRGLLAGALFGADSLVPLTLSVQHGYGATAAGLPLATAGLMWAAGSWWQGRDGQPDRVRLIRAGFTLVTVAAVGAAIVSLPDVPGWWMYLAWALAGLGAGLAMSSVGVLLLNYTTDADRGRDSAALQLADVTTSALTTGLAGVLVAAAARGAIGYTAAFVTLDLAMAGLAAVGIAAAGQARPAPIMYSAP